MIFIKFFIKIKTNYRLYFTLLFKLSLALNEGARLASIMCVLPVLKLYIGFDLISLTLNLPKLDSVTLSPCFNASLITSMIVSRHNLQSFLVSPVFEYTAFTNSFLFIISSEMMISNYKNFNHLILYFIMAESFLLKIFNKYRLPKYTIAATTMPSKVLLQLVDTLNIPTKARSISEFATINFPVKI